MKWVMGTWRELDVTAASGPSTSASGSARSFCSRESWAAVWESRSWSRGGAGLRTSSRRWVRDAQHARSMARCQLTVLPERRRACWSNLKEAWVEGEKRAEKVSLRRCRRYNAANVTDMWRRVRWSAYAVKCFRRGVGDVDGAKGGRTSGHGT